jgi:hypothetical protein
MEPGLLLYTVYSHAGTSDIFIADGGWFAMHYAYKTQLYLLQLKLYEQDYNFPKKKTKANKVGKYSDFFLSRNILQCWFPTSMHDNPAKRCVK